MRGATPERMAAVRAASIAAQSARRIEGLAYARAWRIRNKPIFDAMVGGEA